MPAITYLARNEAPYGTAIFGAAYCAETEIRRGTVPSASLAPTIFMLESVEPPAAMSARSKHVGGSALLAAIAHPRKKESDMPALKHGGLRPITPGNNYVHVFRQLRGGRLKPYVVGGRVKSNAMRRAEKLARGAAAAKAIMWRRGTYDIIMPPSSGRALRRSYYRPRPYCALIK